MAPLSQLALALALTPTAWCLPQWWGSRGTWTSSWNENDGSWGGSPTPTIPLKEDTNTGASPLPTPTSQVQFVLLGVGFQNYTCSSATDTYIQTVPDAGAIATLYDITRDIRSYTSDRITSNVLKAFEMCLKVTNCSPSVANNYCDTCHSIAAAPYRNNLAGEHFFDQVNAAQSPNFDVFSKGDFISAKKTGSIAAPSTAYKGSNGLGAVGWLYLTPNGSPLTRGVTSVYRIETAGGVAPSTCDGSIGQLSVPYTAEYWFYN